MAEVDDPSLPASQRYDLRRIDSSDVVGRVESALGVRLRQAGSVRKRRSIGAPTDRGTWIRIEVRGLDKLGGQGWGAEAAHTLDQVAKPLWHAGFSWFDAAREVMWRADETERIMDAPVKPGGLLTIDPRLSPEWWATFDRSLDALAAHRTPRLATVDTEPMSQRRLTATIEHVFPGMIDTEVEEWDCAHADLGWANLTAPRCYLLDWEDWGVSPRGTDAAKLWSSSLALPALADAVREHRHADLGSRTGRLMMLFYCSQIIATTPGHTSPLHPQAGDAADSIIRELRR